MQCENARDLVPLYADGELSEAQAAPLRRHLMDCPTCREHVQGAKALRRWFVPTEAVTVPEGFAARVTAAALASETSDPGVAELVAPRAGARAVELELRRFVLRSVAVAAAVLLVLSAAIQLRSRPSAVDLEASELPAVLEGLDELNRSAEQRPSDETPRRPRPPAGAGSPRR